MNPIQFTVGTLAERVGIHVETVRYYERRRLLPNPARTNAGYRLYDETSIARLRFIKRAQELGFTLEEIADLLALRVDAASTCDDVRNRAAQKVAEIEDKIRSLQAMRAALVEMIGACEQDGPAGDCPFLDSLAQQTQERSGGTNHV
jgi:Hg(II)-responsive transcriptional regulator